MSTGGKILAVLWIVLGVVSWPVVAGQAEADSHSPTDSIMSAYKVLYVMSYHSPWRWTDGQLDGFKEALKGVDVQYRSFQLDTKRHNAPQWKEKKGREARNLIESWKPDLVYTSDDDAQTYVTQYYANRNTPFVFSGVNKDPKEYGFDGSRNITGVVEHEHFTESVRLIKSIVPEIRRIAVVFDDASMWPAVMRRMKAQAPRLDGVAFVAWDVIETFAEYKQKIKEYHQTADAVGLIGIFNFKDEHGANVPYQEVLRWTAENSRLPDFSFWADRVHYGTLCAVNVSEYEQGLAAGRIARSILAEGRRPSDFPIKPTVKGYPIVSLARANQLGLRVKSGVLLSAEVIQGFEWDKE